MKKIFGWVPWFQEFARKINEGDRHTLADKARRIDWGKRNPALLKFGDENIDPFSLMYYLAALYDWETVYPSVAEVFDIREPIDYASKEHFYFPTPPVFAALFHDKGDGNPVLLWNLFEQAVSNSISSDTFEAALEIRGVGVPKLTQTLFLIDPTKFLPFDGKSSLALGIGKFKNPPSKINWDEYCQELERIKEAFPGCECYEINMFSYLWKNGKMPINSQSCFQVSTNVYNTGDDYWEDFDNNSYVYTGGPGNGEGWPEQGEPAPSGRYSLDAPICGDIMLVRFGLRKGHAIGIVYENEYKENLSGKSKLYVLWVNKREFLLSGNVPIVGFSRAWDSTKKAFRSTTAYSPTFELLERLGGGATPPKPPPQPSVDHPCNQILYGPPGTGKTWNAVNYAMAIVYGVGVGGIGEGDRAQFRAFRFEPKVGAGQIAMVTFHQSFSYEDFVEGIRPKLHGVEIGYELRDGVFKQIVNVARENPDHRYVLIIDEINRGNIPKTFGELITLIEDSKRLGETDEMSVTLPYSNQDFGVPSNLYIIGTMNTADRSILLLDTALRRRFDFVEMMPDSEHERISANVQGVELQKMLKAMNERISLLLDREHQIGHTYLFDVTDLKSLSDKFHNKIFPLLQEYFYDDWSKIRKVLGGAGFIYEQKLRYTRQLRKSNFVDEDQSVYERLPKENSKWLDPDEYKKIYSDDKGSESF